MALAAARPPTVGLTLLGAAIAAAGLVLVLDVISGAELSTVGVLWALGAMVGAATYFVISADESNGLPGISLAAGGLLVGGTVLLPPVLSGCCRSTPPPRTRSTTGSPSHGGSPSSRWAW